MIPKAGRAVANLIPISTIGGPVQKSNFLEKNNCKHAINSWLDCPAETGDCTGESMVSFHSL